MHFENQINFKVSGRRALFTDPLTKMGGEKFTYPIPTFQALKGVVESIYWKPTFVWVIDRLRVMKRVCMETQSIRPIEYGGGNTLAIYTYLTDVEYRVQAHFEWNTHRPELEPDRNENKHYFIAKRMIEKGGRRDVFLGTRECQAYVEPCDFEEGTGFYDDQETEMHYGMMLHGLSYPDEYGTTKLSARLWAPVMSRGVVDFPHPTDPKLIVRPLRDQAVKPFIPGQNFALCDVLFESEGGTE